MSTLTTSVNNLEGIQRWTVNHFSLLPKEPGNAIKSPEFAMAGHEGWQLLLYPGGYDAEAKGYVSLYLKNVNGVRAQLSLGIINQAQMPEHRYRSHDVRNFEGSGNLWGYYRFIQRDALMDEKCGHLLQDSVIFECKVVVVTDIVHHVGRVAGSAGSERACAAKLVGDMSQLLHSSLYSDVTLVAQGVEFRAHKAILAARSPVFKAMFDSSMRESVDGVVTIEDIKPAVFRQLLRFMYTGCYSEDDLEEDHEEVSRKQAVVEEKKSDADVEDAEEESGDEDNDVEEFTGLLLVAADRYQLSELVELSSSRLMDSLSPENVADRLILADQCQAIELKNLCLEYLSSDPRRLAACMSTAGFARLSKMRPTMLLPLLEAMVPASAQQDSRKRQRDTPTKFGRSQLKRKRS